MEITLQFGRFIAIQKSFAQYKNIKEMICIETEADKDNRKHSVSLTSSLKSRAPVVYRNAVFSDGTEIAGRSECSR